MTVTKIYFMEKIQSIFVIPAWNYAPQTNIHFSFSSIFNKIKVLFPYWYFHVPYIVYAIFSQTGHILLFLVLYRGPAWPYDSFGGEESPLLSDSARWHSPWGLYSLIVIHRCVCPSVYLSVYCMKYSYSISSPVSIVTLNFIWKMH